MLDNLTNAQRGYLTFAAGAVAGVLLTLLAGVWLSGPSAPNGGDRAGTGVSLRPEEHALSGLPASTHAATAEPEYPYALEGRVTDGAGRGLAGARVTVRDREGGPAQRVITESDGRFVVPNVPLGLYTVEANATGFTGVSLEQVAPEGAPIELRLVSEGAAVGRVVADGAGVSGVTVLIGGPGVFPPARQTSGAEGRFAVETWSGVDLVEVAAFGDETGSGFVRRPAPRDGATFELPLRPAPPLRLELIDEAGAAIATGSVTLAAGPLHLLDVSAVIEGGRAELRGLPPGDYYARVRSPGYLPWEGTLVHHGGAQPQSLELGRGATVAGRVLDPSGQGVAEAFLNAVVRDPEGRRWRFGMVGEGSLDQLVTTEGHTFWPPDYTVRSDAAGGFRVSGLPPGRVVLLVAKPGFVSAESDPLELAPGATLEGIEVRLIAE